MFEVMESRPTDMDCLLLESRVEDSIDGVFRALRFSAGFMVLPCT